MSGQSYPLIAFSGAIFYSGVLASRDKGGFTKYSMIDQMQETRGQRGKFLADFKEFAMRGSVLDLAIGVIIGTSLSAVTNSLVKDILMPPIGLLLSDVDFSNLFIDLSGHHYATLREAQAAGAATINYGQFINIVINFLVIALVIFLMVKQINRLRRNESPAPTEKNCSFCQMAIPLAATRCPHCTSQL